MKGTSPTQRSLKWLRDRGYIAAVVEQNVRIPAKFNEPARVFKRDLFGFCDIVAVGKEFGSVYIQVTSASNQAARRTKIEESEFWPIILKAGNTIECHGWRKGGARGERKLWRLTRHQARIHGDGIQWLEMTENLEETSDIS